MIILGIDLAWNTSGWAVFDTERLAFLAWGVVAPPESRDEPKYLQRRGQRLQTEWASIVNQYTPDTIVYEATDWLRPSSEYGHERRALGGLKRAEITLLLAWPEPVFCKIGAKEVKAAFRAQRKDVIARYLAAEFPAQFEFEAGQLVSNGQRLTLDESDALAVCWAWWLTYGKDR